MWRNSAGREAAISRCPRSGRKARGRRGPGAEILDTLETKESHFKPLYDDEMSLEDKINTIAREIYGADGVDFGSGRKARAGSHYIHGMGDFPVCMAKTQYSLSDDAKKLGRPEHFRINVREVYVSCGS